MQQSIAKNAKHKSRATCLIKLLTENAFKFVLIKKKYPKGQ
jgi:hypothetical protein